MQHVVQYSGGTGSWMAARRVIERHGADTVTLLFADVNMEDEDLYRFLDESSENLGVPITRISDGRDPWDVFFDKRYLGNSRIDPCSRILKRELLWDWIAEHGTPEDTIVHLGIDWSESHRFERAAERAKPWIVKAPLCDPPYLDKDEIHAALAEAGIALPRLYGMGFPHNNCGGFCIKAGQAQFKLLLEQMPERYRYHEERELELREHLGKDIAILRDRSKAARAQNDGKPMPLTLLELRVRIQEERDETDPFDLGGCGCAVD